MKKTMLFTFFAISAVFLFIAFAQAQPAGSQSYGISPEGDWYYCPHCGSYIGPGHGQGYRPHMMGPGAMGYGMGPHMTGRGMGPGMMHRGWGRGRRGSPCYGYQCPYRGNDPMYKQSREPMEQEEARNRVQNYLDTRRNPNLKIGEIEDKEKVFEISIVTKDDSLVDKLLVDKRTGSMHSIY